jgi:hypothetical protein
MPPNRYKKRSHSITKFHVGSSGRLGTASFPFPPLLKPDSISEGVYIITPRSTFDYAKGTLLCWFIEFAEIQKVMRCPQCDV